MPYFPSTSRQTDYASVDKRANAGTDFTFASEYQSGLSRTPGSAIAAVASVGGVVTDLVDTVASSVIPGVNRQDVNNKVFGAFGSPGLQGWMDQNRGSIEVASGIAGVIAADYIAGRILKPAGAAMKMIRGVPFARTIATLDSRHSRALALAKALSRETALRGSMGIERVSANQMTLARLGQPGLVTSSQIGRSAVRRTQLAKGLARNVTTEAVMAAGLHTNEFLYDDSIAHNLAWSVAGLGIGGVVDSLVSAHTLRKINNSAEMRKLNARALDPTGIEEGRLSSVSAVNDLLADDAGFRTENQFMFANSGAETDKITSLAILANDLRKPGVVTSERSKALFRNREKAATPQLAMAMDELQKVTTRGARGIARSGFSTKILSLGDALRESLIREPASMHGIESIFTTAENMTHRETIALRNQNINFRKQQVGKLLEDGGKYKVTRKKQKDGTTLTTQKLIPLSAEAKESLELELKQLDFDSKGVPVVMLEPGEWASMETARVLENYKPIQPDVEGGLGVDDIKIWKKPAEKGEATLGISSQGELFIPGNGRLESLKVDEMVNLYQVGNKMIRDFKSAGQTFTVQEKASWFVLDMAEQMATAGVPVKYIGKMTRETAMVESFAQKVTAIKKHEQAVKLAGARGASESMDEARLFELKIKYNLPRFTSYEQGLMQTHETPIDLLISGMRKGDEVRKMSPNELLKTINDAKQIKGFTDEGAPTFKSTQGNSFNFLMTSEGTAITPVMGIKRPMQPFEWSRDELLTRISMKHANTRDILTGEGADPYLKELVELITSDPNALEARKVLELADDQQGSFIPGFQDAAPQTTRSAALNAVTSRDRRDVDNLTMLAASKTNENARKVNAAHVKEAIESTMGDVVTRVNSPRNVGTKLLLNQFHSFRPGYEILPTPKEITLPGGKKGFVFELDHTSAINKEIFERQQGAKLTKGQTMLAPNGTQVMVDELGMEALVRQQQLHKIELSQKNTLLRSQGLKEIKEVPWYAPPPRDKGKFIAYEFDGNNNIIPHSKITATSPEGLSTAIARAEADLKSGHIIRQRGDIESFATLWDKAQMDYLPPNTTAIQPGKSNKGTSGVSQLNMSAFDESLVTSRENLLNMAGDTIDILYDDVIKAARARGKIARLEAGVGDDVTTYSGIHEQFIENLRGRPAKLDFFEAAEKRINRALASPTKLTPSVLTDAVTRYSEIYGKKSLNGARFDKLAQELGDHMPFKSAQEMVERETGSKLPKELAEISRQLSWFEGASRLRWMESMHAVANFASIVANAPSVMKALQPLAGETVEQTARRNSSLAMMVATPDGKSFGMIHSHKLMWRGMKAAWKGELDEFTKLAIREGDMQQDVIEMNSAFNSIKDRNGLYGFMLGNDAAEYGTRTGLGLRNKIARSGGIDSWLGILSDKSEAFSRQWATYMGREAALAVGITDPKQQLAMARDLANKTIANYDPANRPAIFQGALGAPIGLFQSYIYNFYNRMFRYIETGNGRALATQYATQSAVFGVESVPGWEQFNSAFFRHRENEDEDPVDSMYKRFGTADGDLIMHGVLSNLPKLLNLLPGVDGVDGVSIYTRGDSAFRAPINPVLAVTDLTGITDSGHAAQIPVADTVKRIVNGLGAGVSTLWQRGEISTGQISEILSNMITNRPMAGLIESFGAGGYDTSNDAQVVSKSVGWSETLARVAGVRAMRQQNEIQAFYENKNAGEEQNARQSILRSAAREAVRDNKFDSLPGMFREYVENGGSPAYYSRWLNDLASSALDSRGERMLSDALSNTNNPDVAAIGRLLDSQVTINEDNLSDEDYGREEQMNQLIDQGFEGSPEI